MFITIHLFFFAGLKFRRIDDITIHLYRDTIFRNFEREQELKLIKFSFKMLVHLNNMVEEKIFAYMAAQKAKKNKMAAKILFLN